MAFITAGEILNRVASEVSLDETPDPYGSQDPTFIQLRRLLQSAAGDLLNARPVWPQLAVPYTFWTVAGQTSYTLPPDFRGMMYQTGWNKTLRAPLAGPALPAQWQRVLNSGAGSSLNVIFRLTPLNLLVQPPPPEGVEISFEYASSHWVAPAGEPSPTTDTPSASADVIWFDDLLMVRAVKLKYLVAKSFPADDAKLEYRNALEAALGRAGGAPRLSLYRPVTGRGTHTVGEAGGEADPFSQGILY